MKTALNRSEYTWAYVSQVANIGTSAAGTLAMPWALGLAMYGRLSALTGLVYLSVNFFDTFFNVLAVKGVSEDRKFSVKRIFLRKLALSLLIGSLVCSYYVCSGMALRFGHALVLSASILLLSVAFPALSFLESLLTCSHMNRTAAATRSIQGASWLLVLVSCRYGFIPVYSVILVQALTYAAVCLWLVRFRFLWLTTSPWPSAVAGDGQYIGAWILSFIPSFITWGLVEIGAAEWSDRTLALFRLIQVGLAFAVGLFPIPSMLAFYVGNTKGQPALEKNTTALWLSGLLSAGAALFGPLFVRLLYGYYISGDVVAIMAVSVALQGVYWIAAGQLVPKLANISPLRIWAAASILVVVALSSVAMIRFGILSGALAYTGLWVAVTVGFIVLDPSCLRIRYLAAPFVAGTFSYLIANQLLRIMGEPEHILGIRTLSLFLALLSCYALVVLFVVLLRRRLVARAI